MANKKYDFTSNIDNCSGFYEWNKSLYLIKNNDERANQFKEEKKEHGFSDDETWSLDSSITLFVLPRLKRFREIVKDCGSYPANLKNLNSWLKILDKMIFSFEIMFKEWKTGEFISKEAQEKKNEGLKLFAEYFEDLWW